MRLPAGHRTGFDGLAGADDIEAAYRLLLGREPDQEGLSERVDRLGTLTLGELVQEFVESAEFRTGPLALMLAPPGSHRLEQVDVEGLQMLVSADDSAVGRAVVDSGRYEPEVTAAIRDRLEPGSCFLDVGCNIGWYVLQAARVVGPTGSVIGVEASPDSAAVSAWNARLNGFTCVEIHPFGADDHAGTVQLERWRGTNAQFVPPGRGAGEPAAFTTTVRTFALDEALGPLDTLDVVKLDVEGAEARAVRGAAALLEQHRPVVFTEFNPGLLQTVSETTGSDYLAWFTERDWEVAVVGEGAGPVDPAQLQARWAADPDEHLDLVLTPRR